MDPKEIEIFYPTSLTAWRTWLSENHVHKPAVWLVFYNKSAGKATISWSEAVDVALCFGWIDSKKIKIDSESSHQYFTKRKAKSPWSKINKEKVTVLLENGLMTQAGMAAVELAKQNGSWNTFDEAEALIVPEDLEAAFNSQPIAKEFYLRQSKSIKKGILQWLVLAKRPETRQKRLNEIIELATQSKKPKHL